MRKKTIEFLPPSDEEIAAYAYYLWDAEGRPSGRDLDYWLEAEAHLHADRKFEAGVLPKAPLESARRRKPSPDPIRLAQLQSSL